MQKNISSICAQSNDRSKFEKISTKGVSNAKVIKAYNGTFEPLDHILNFIRITAYVAICCNFKDKFGNILHIR